MSDTIYARSGKPFFSELDNAPTGLVGTIGVQVLRKSDNVAVVARTTTGIVESPAGSGRYVFSGTAPLAAGSYTVFWDQGSVTPETTAADDLEVVTSASVDVLPTGGDLCTPDDVARVLAIEPTPDPPWSEKAIETASSWARRYLRRPDIGVSGTTVESSFHVGTNSYVSTEGQPAKVEVVSFPGEDPSELEDDLWEFDGQGIRLFPNPNVWWVNGFKQVGPWSVERKFYQRVDVTVEQPGDIDPTLRDGVAVASAALMTRAPRLAKGLNAERIGDYSYTLTRIETSDPWFEQAKALLRPLRRVPDLVP